MKYKQIVLKITNASPGQILTLKNELNLMSRAWKSYGPNIEVKAGKIKEPTVNIKRSVRLW